MVFLLLLYDFGFEILVGIFEIVNLLIEDVDKGEESVVLLFGLDEGVLNFLDVG